MRGACSSRATATLRTVVVRPGLRSRGAAAVRCRLRAGGLDAPPRGADERGSARMSGAEATGPTVSERSGQSSEDASGQGRRCVGRGMVSGLGRGPGGPVQGAVLVLVV